MRALNCPPHCPTRCGLRRESSFVKEVLPEALICTYLDLQEQVIAEAIRNVGDYREKLFRLA